MPSTYTGSGIELIGDGEQSGSWGDTTNNNLEIIDRLTSQAGVIGLAGTTHTLSLSDGTLSDGQYAVLVFGGAPSGTNTVTINPNDAKRVFIVKNNSGESVVMTQGSGGNVTVPDGRSAIVYCDGNGSGAAVVSVSEDFVTGTLAAIGALTPTDGNFIVGDGSTWVAESGNTVLNSMGVTATAAELNTMDGITATTSDLNTASTHYVPSGGIIMWSGSIAAIPSGWVLCDGNNSTPNLTDRFVVGAGGTYSVGNIGGANSVTLTTSEVPAHTHTFSATTGSAGDHSHTYSGTTGTESRGHTHSFSDSGTTSSAGNHNHGITGNIYVGNGSYTGEAPSTYGSNYYTSGNTTNNAGSHSHSFSVSGTTGAVSQTHTHTFSGTTSTIAAHTHSVSGTTASTGGGAAHENRPPYYALAYIMKT